MEREERIRTLAGKIRANQKFSDALASAVDRMAKPDREIVIAAVVASGVHESRIVRAIRSEFTPLQPLQEGVVKLDEFEGDFDQKDGLKKV